MNQTPVSSYKRLVQAIEDDSLSRMLGAPTPTVITRDIQQIHCDVYKMNDALGSDPTCLLATLRSDFGINGEVRLYCANWHADFVEHCTVIGSAANEEGWGLLLKCECPDDIDAHASGWLCLVEGPDAAQRLCESLEHETLRLVALGIEWSLQRTNLPLNFDRSIALRYLLAESSVGQDLLRAWDTHARNSALEAALPSANSVQGPRLRI